MTRRRLGLVRAVVWLLVWLVLLVGSGLYLWRRARPLPRTVSDVMAEVDAATARLDEVESAFVPMRMPVSSAADLAVFMSPRAARAAWERQRSQARDARALRRDARLPAWARRAMPRGYTASLPARPGTAKGHQL
jgi:hypothetical protein